MGLCISSSNDEFNLLEINASSIPLFPFKQTYNARVVSVYDGDTVTILFRHDNTIFKYALRINGIDTAEIRKNATTPPDYTKLGLEAKQFVKELLLPADTLVMVKLYKYDKYGGRIIGDIYIKEKHMYLSDLLLLNHLALPYKGDKKLSPSDYLALINRRRSSFPNEL